MRAWCLLAASVVTAEAAELAVCEAFYQAELRRTAPQVSFQASPKQPVVIERSPRRVGAQAVGMVLWGKGVLTVAGLPEPTEFVCLLESPLRAVAVFPRPAGFGEPRKPQLAAHPPLRRPEPARR